MPKKKAEVVEVKAAEEEEPHSNKTMIIVLCVMGGLIVLAMIDSFTTKYFSRMCAALAKWTMDNAPGSFVVYELIIMIFLVCCLPYGPLGVLSGALFVQKYGNKGIYMAGIALFITTMCGACICFVLARNNFKEAVQKQIDRTPKLKFLKNLDRLIQNGQGVEMVILIRLAPLPKGPTNYFLGTTSLTWRDFILGSSIVGLPMSFLDVCIGAGAKNVKKDNPVSIALFVTALVLFVGLICFVGSRAKRKLMALDQEDTNEEADEELAELNAEDEESDEEDTPPVKRSTKGGAPASVIYDDVLGHEEPIPESLLDKVDDLQVIGKPNSWVYPDARLNLSRTSDEAGRKVDAVTVQLNSATFSFQVVSSRLGWPLRIYPKNAKPKFGMHASEDGVLKVDQPSAVECAASDGSVRKGAGHGHNFHIVENTGDVVTIYVAREMKPAYDEYAGLGDKVSLNEAQLEQVYYQVWYEVAKSDDDAQVSFVGGDGIDISKSKRFSLGMSKK